MEAMPHNKEHGESVHVDNLQLKQGQLEPNHMKNPSSCMDNSLRNR